MAELEFRLPSAIPYAYVNWRGTEEEAARLNPEMLATLYANTLNAFQQAEAAAGRAIAAGARAPVSQPAAPVLEESSGDQDEAVQAVTEGLGATEIDDVNAPPYRQAAPAAKPKPWETKKPAPEVVVDVDGW